MKFCPKAGVNLFFLTCKLSKRKKISSDNQNNIMVKSTDGDIILDCQIKTHDDWVARVEFLQENSDERAQSDTVPCKKNINDLDIELGHPSDTITHVLLKPLVFKSLVHSCCVKIAL